MGGRTERLHLDDAAQSRRADGFRRAGHADPGDGDQAGDHARIWPGSRRYWKVAEQEFSECARVQRAVNLSQNTSLLRSPGTLGRSGSPTPDISRSRSSMTERGALTEHAAPERLVVARGLFTGPERAGARRDVRPHRQRQGASRAQRPAPRARRDRRHQHLLRPTSRQLLPALDHRHRGAVEARLRRVRPGHAAAARLGRRRHRADRHEQGGRRHRHRGAVGAAQRVRRRRRAVDGMQSGRAVR